MSPISKLTELLSKLPGLGPRQARRVVQYLLARDEGFRAELATMIRDMSQHTAQCSLCLRYDDPNSEGLCTTCANPERDRSTLIVVEHDVDIDAIELSLTYKGLYFVLGGLLNLIKQRKDKVVRITELMRRIERGTEGGLQEVIFALSTTPEGDYTAREVMKAVEDKCPSLKTTLLGRGLSVGAEVEYADPETLRSALKNRS